AERHALNAQNGEAGVEIQGGVEAVGDAAVALSDGFFDAEQVFEGEGDGDRDRAVSVGGDAGVGLDLAAIDDFDAAQRDAVIRIGQRQGDRIGIGDVHV